MQAEEHVGESAELYAVGALEPAERDAVDAHIARCPECLRRVGEAEETVLALERANAVDEAVLPQRRRLHFPLPAVAWLLPLTAAAAFVVGLLIPRPAPQNDLPTLAMIGSHFSHAQFAGSGPPAKAIYAHDRSWYYVIVAGSHRYGVYGIRDGRSARLGSTEPQGGTSEFFVRGSISYGSLELRDGQRTIEAAVVR